MIDYVVILAGGYGSRLNSLTNNCSKAMLNVNGKPLINYSLTQITGIKNRFITVGPFKQQLIANSQNFGIFNFIDTKDKGNSWFLFNSEIKEKDAPVLVLPCDIITTIDTVFIYEEYARLQNPLNMLIPTDNHIGYEGDYIWSENYNVQKLDRKNTSANFCSGIQVLNPKKINEMLLKDSIIESDFQCLWQRFIDKGFLYHSRPYPHPWFTVNNLTDLNKYEEICFRIRY